MVIKGICLERGAHQTIQCEGFFRTIKNEFFYPNDWKYTTCDDFITELEKYLIWFKNKRIKKRLGYLSPKELMLNYNQY